MNAVASSATRTAPQRTLDKWRAWHMWSARWNTAYIIIGGGSSALATIVAANTKAHFFLYPYDIILAVCAALLTFLINAQAAQSKGSAFETAARELKKAIAGYETDVAITVADLGKAQQRGINLLNRLKAPQNSLGRATPRQPSRHFS